MVNTNPARPAMMVAAIFLAGTLLLGGCASIVSGTTQMVQVHSEPKGASIQLDGIHVGVTPRLLKIRRGSAHTLMIWKDGYEPGGDAAEASGLPDLFVVRQVDERMQAHRCFPPKGPS